VRVCGGNSAEVGDVLQAESAAFGLFAAAHLAILFIMRTGRA